MGLIRRAIHSLPLLLVCATAAVCTAAAEPAPNLINVPVIALKQGQTIEPTVTGQNLSTLASAAVADPRGLTIELIKPPKPESGQVQLKITASADAALGDREFRLIGPAGVTRPVRVYISQFTVVQRTAPSTQPALPQDAQLPALLVGKIEPAGEVDQFRFSATKGQQLIFDVYASRIGSPLQAVATIHSSFGREVSSILEHRATDPVLIFDPPEDGTYVLRLRDLQYRGGGDFAYRINAGHIPLLEAVLPSSGQPGRVVEAQASGYNIDPGQKITVDLTMAAPGRIDVRANTPLGISNSIPFEVTDLPQAVECEPNNKAEQANALSLPVEVSGHIDQSGDEDYFKFHLAYKQAVNVEVLAARYGSPVTPLLQLRDAKGNVIESNDGTADADARIARELDAGDYLVSVRDLTFAGGSGYWYRLKLQPAGSVPQDFAVQFLPDSLRIYRGGNVAIWCDVKRLNGFTGPVTIAPEGLPPGLNAAPIVLDSDSSGWFTIAASPDAALGSAPLRLRATATLGTASISKYAQPQIDGRDAADAYVTVVEPAPFTIDAVATMSTQQIEQLNAEIATLANKLSTPDPRIDAAMAEWEKTIAVRPTWTVLNPISAASAKSTPLNRQPDGSFLASGAFPAQDQYTVIARTDLKGITAIRLEVLSDDRLPTKGPGAAPNGNFVLTEFKLAANKTGQPAQPIALKKATADYSQKDYPAAAAIDNNPATGWAVDPQEGHSHAAVFQLASPIGDGDDTILTFALQHESQFPQHNIGRFRLSVTGADAATIDNQSDVPPEILAIAAVPKDQRTAQQKTDLINYFRTIDPQTLADRARLEALRNFIAPYAQIERFEKMLGTQTPQLDAEQGQWEQSLAAGAGWMPMEITDAKSANGAQLDREADGSIFAGGNNPPTDTYVLTAQSSLKGITALRLEALPDARLAGNGPGRAGDGNFLLTRFRVAAISKPPAGPGPQEVVFDSARASLEQQGYGIAGALDDKNDTGWGISPDSGRPAEATFYPKQPIGGDAGSTLTITLEQLSNQPQHTLGHFRIWATANKEPDAALRVPQVIAAILKTPAGARSEQQKREIAQYFRSIAPSLAPVRQQLADLRSQVPSLPLKLRRGELVALPVPINRAGGFRGDVQVSLIGYAKGREGNNPAPIERDIKFAPVTLSGDSLLGALVLESEGGAEPGTRMVVLKGETKIGDQTIVQYSPAFPLTIQKREP